MGRALVLERVSHLVSPTPPDLEITLCRVLTEYRATNILVGSTGAHRRRAATGRLPSMELRRVSLRHHHHHGLDIIPVKACGSIRDGVVYYLLELAAVRKITVPVIVDVIGSLIRKLVKVGYLMGDVDLVVGGIPPKRVQVVKESRDFSLRVPAGFRVIIKIDPEHHDILCPGDGCCGRAELERRQRYNHSDQGQCDRLPFADLDHESGSRVTCSVKFSWPIQPYRMVPHPSLGTL